MTTTATAYYSLAEVQRLLPPLPPKPKRHVCACSAGAAISGDDLELIAALGQRSPVFGRLYAGDTSDYVHKDGVNDNEVDWALAQDLLRATGGDQERTYRLMRQSALERDKWDERRNGDDYLTYTIARAAESPSEAVRAVFPVTTGECPSCATYRRQIDLINQLVRSDLPKLYKLVLLYLMTVVGFTQARGQTTFKTSGKRLGEILGMSDQSARGVLHSLARTDRGKLNNPHGVFDLDATRTPELGPFASVFEITPLTSGGYAGFLEGVLANADNLKPAPKPPRQKHVPVPPPAFVETVPDCRVHQEDLLVSEETPREIVCAGCGNPFLALTRTVYYGQNDKNYRLKNPQEGAGLQSDKNCRSGQPPVATLPDDWSERLGALYERAGMAP